MTCRKSVNGFTCVGGGGGVRGERLKPNDFISFWTENQLIVMM